MFNEIYPISIILYNETNMPNHKKKDKGRSHRACTGAFTLCPLFICLPNSKGGKIVASKAGQNGQDRAKHSRSRRQN
jgi:Zn-finger protein